MEIKLDPAELSGEIAQDSIFGGNILASRGDLTGDGSYAEAIADMNVTALRYPGGSLTEHYFDLENPDADTAVHYETGETSDFIPISDFLEFADEGGHAATIVIPTHDQLSDEVDENGDRINAIEEDVLREFVHDVMTGVYGDADIAAFELGNEYWGSGKMNAVEYGRLTAEMSVIIKDEMRLIEEIYDDIDTSGTDVVVQMGDNYGTSRISEEYEGWDAEDVIDDLNEKYEGADISYDNIRGYGEPNWTEINNELVQMSYDTPEEINAVDGIVAHVYSRGEGNDTSKSYSLKNIHNTWLDDEGFEDLKIYVTEWNQKSTSGLNREEDYGLLQAHEILNIVEEFMAYGVDEAHVWPLIQNTANPLSVGMDYSEMTAPGHMFSMISENVAGKTALDLSPGSDRETQLESQDVHLHGFAGDDELVFYIASVADDTTTTEVDITSLVSSYGEMEITILGVAEGEAVGNTRSEAEIEEVNPGDIVQDGVITATLDEREIMQVVIRDVEPTEEFAATMAAANGETPIDPVDPVDPDTPDEPDPDTPIDPEDPDEDPVTDTPTETPRGDDDDSDSGWAALGDLAWIAALLPLLTLAGFA
jgi:hypothetical protein